MRRILIVGVLIVAAVSTVAPAAEAGGPSVCSGRLCTVSNASEYVTALAELEGSGAAGRIELDANVTLTGAFIDPTYAGPGQLTIAGSGTFTLSGFTVSTIIDDTSGATLTFEAITVRAGFADDGSAVVDATGGVHVADSTFEFNTSTSAGVINGGAIRSGGDVTIENSTLRNNVASSTSGNVEGGAVRALGKVTVTGSTVEDNRAETTAGTGEGGAIWADQGVTFTDSTLNDNRASASGVAHGGGIYTPDRVTITDATLDGNEAVSSAATASGGGAYAFNTTTVNRSIFILNEARGVAAVGGGLFIDGAGVDRIEETLFRENRAQSTTAEATGGGIHNGGDGLLLITGTTLRDNNAISSSGGTSGAGIHTDGGILRVIDGAVVRNYADQTTGSGGGIKASNTPVELYNVTLAENIGPNGSGLWSDDKVTTRFATVVGNKALAGVGQLVTSDQYAASATAVGDADPSGVDTTDCVVGSTFGGNGNYESGTSCGFTIFTNQQNVSDMMLGPVRDNGGPQAGPAEIATGPTTRLSMFPLPGSPLIDTLTPGQCNSAFGAVPALSLDSRDVPRPTGPDCDTGATEAIFPAHPFSDVTPFYEATVRWVTNDSNVPQILSGFPDGTFGHQLNITRGQAARLYYRAAGAPDVSALPAHGFSDATLFFEDAIRWAKANGIFNGFPDNTFRPNAPINRGNYIRSLYGFAGSQDVSGLPAHPFTDVTLFYEDAVTWAKARGLADGFPDDTFRQNNNINRGNASRTVYNLAQTESAWGLSSNLIPVSMIIKTNIDIF